MTPADTLPSRPPATSGTIRIGDTLTRTIAAALQADTLRFTCVVGQRVHVDVQQLTAGFDPGTLTYTLVDSPGSASLFGISVAPTAIWPDLNAGDAKWSGATTTDCLVIMTSQSYLTIVQSENPTVVTAPPFVGTYRVRLVGSNPAPESAVGRLTTGMSVTESIDAAGDVDDFTLVGTKGQAIVLFLKGLTGRGSDTVVVGSPLDWPNLPSDGWARSPGDDSRPAGAWSGRSITLPADTLRVRVRAATAATTGKYQFTYRVVDPAPEGIASILSAGDTVASTIEYPGDIDEYTFTGSPDSVYSVAIQATSGNNQDKLRFIVEPAYPSVSLNLTLDGTTPRLLDHMSARFPGGTPTKIRVSSEDGISQGTYRVAVVPINPAPELRGSSLTFGDTITESIAFTADYDEYFIQANAGDMLTMFAQAGGPDSLGQLRVRSVFPGGQPLYVFDPKKTLREGTTTVVAQTAGSYKITVEGLEGYHGPYRLAVAKINPSPETANPVLHVNVPVTEAADPPGDVDRFTFDGTAGQEVAVYMQILPSRPGEPVTGSGSFILYRAGSATPAVGTAGTDSLGKLGTGLVDLPFTGTNVIEAHASSPTGEAVPYRLMVYQPNRAPELAPAEIHIGDKITNETIWPSADRDDFHLTGAAGAHFQACLRNRLAPTASPFQPMWLVVADPNGSNIALLAKSLSTDGAATCGSSVIPASGAMTIRVYGLWPAEAFLDEGGPYELEIVRVP